MQPQDRTHQNDAPEDNADAWDDRDLGADAEHARRVPASRERQLHQMIDESLNLKMISIRLQEGLIEALKEIAEKEGIGYQPLIRQVLTGYVRDRARGSEQ